MELKWRRGTFEINLTKRARSKGASNLATGWMSEPFAVHVNELCQVILTHLPTGANIPTDARTQTAAKAFASQLLAAAGPHDWRGPKGASPKKNAPTRRSAWFRSAKKVWWIVYGERLKRDE